MSRPVCSECLCVIDETGCGCVHPIEPFTNHEQEEKMNANELMPQLEELKVEVLKLIEKNTQQQALIEQLEKTQDYLYKTHDADKAEIEALKKPREMIIKGDLYLVNVLPDGGAEVRLKKAMI